METLMLAMQYAKGNPGALAFMVEVLKKENIEFTIPIALTLDSIPTLRGTNLYVLWSDLGGKNLAQVAEICKKVPKDILEDACSRQDYSGREMIRPFMAE